MFLYERTKNCTYQMPRKRGELPQPCTLCGRMDGTYQYVVFNNKNSTSRSVICRIGHYDRNRYKSTKMASKSKLIETKVKHPSGRIWHSFNAYAPFGLTRDGK